MNAVKADDREKYSRQIKELLHRYGLDYHSLGGDYLHRFTEANGKMVRRRDISDLYATYKKSAENLF